MFGFSFALHLRDRAWVPKTYVDVGLGFALAVLLPKLLLIAVNSGGWKDFAHQNNRRNENKHLRSGVDAGPGLEGDTTLGSF